VSFFADVSGEMVYPIVPLFLTATLGAPVVAVGVIEGIAESTASILKLFSGWFSDRIGKRRPLVFGGYALAALAKFGLAAAAAWPFVLIARFVDRAGKGIRTAPRDALIAASSDPASHGRAFGLHRAMDTLGAIVGPLLALLLLALLGDRYRLIFLAALVPGAIGALLVLTVKEVAAPARVGPPPLLLSLKRYDRRFRLFLLVTFAFAIGNSSDVFLILRARDLGLSATAAILAYVVYNCTYAGLSLPAGIRSDRIGRRWLLGVGFIIFAVVYASFALTDRAWTVWPLFAIYGAYIALTDGVGKAYVSDLVPDEQRATALGLYNALTGVAVLFASVLGGVLWDVVGPSATFAFGAGTALLALALLVMTVNDERARVARTG
jgi:MFS family permease